MVFDSIEHAAQYSGLGAGIASALAYFASYDASTHATSVVDLADGVYVNRGVYKTAQNDGVQLEAHRAYVDVMFLAAGEEAFYCKPLAAVSSVTTPYNEQMEACLCPLDADCMKVRFPAGYFAIFFPQDAHCAGQLWDVPVDVKKLIAKVPV